MASQAIPIISFFSGAGGLDCGFRQAGYKVVFACDNFEAAVNSYNLNAKRRVAHVADLASSKATDIRSLIEKQIPDITPWGVVGGPPCQGFSRGNAQADPNDPRNLLPFRYAEILAELNKVYSLRFFVFENVMGLLNPRHIARFHAIRRAFGRAGFHLFHDDLDAQDFGVAQMRRRLFLVGLSKEHFPDPEFEFPEPAGQRTTVRDVLHGLPDPVFFSRGLTTRDIAYHPNHWTMQPRSKKLITGKSTDGRSFRRLNWDQVSPTVAYGNREIHVHPDGGRRLSVHEALLLQGFPAGYCLTGNFSQQITQVSNAVPPPVARALAKRLRKKLVSADRE